MAVEHHRDAADEVPAECGHLHGTGLELLGWDQAHLEERLRGLGDTLQELYAGDGRSPVHAAEALNYRFRPPGATTATQGAGVSGLVA